MTFQEAKKLEELHCKSLPCKFSKTESIATAEALDRITNYCPIEKESFEIVFKLNKDGIIQESWTNKDTEKMQCIRNNFKNTYLFKPPEEPYYTSLTFTGGPILAGHKISFTGNESFNPIVTATGFISEKDGALILSKLNVKLFNDPIYKNKSIYVKNIRIRFNQSNDSETGWGCGSEGEPFAINKAIRIGESLMYNNLELKINLSQLNINRHEWSSVSIQVELEDSIIETKEEIGIL